MLVAMLTFAVSEDVTPGERYEGMDAASAVRSLLAKDALAVHVGAERLVSCTTQRRGGGVRRLPHGHIPGLLRV